MRALGWALRLDSMPLRESSPDSQVGVSTPMRLRDSMES
uniref:Uncharacterized protein n=1 Tax=Anguilla anguilla TaxID=7936 RepID=A0A0E9SR82_ANGAN